MFTAYRKRVTIILSELLVSQKVATLTEATKALVCLKRTSVGVTLTEAAKHLVGLNHTPKIPQIVPQIPNCVPLVLQYRTF